MMCRLPLQAVIAGALLTSVGVKPVCAQAQATPVGVPTPASGWPKPVEDNRVLTYVIFDQLEGRTNGPNTSFRWGGEGWIGTDFNKLWIKSEGRVMNGVTSDGDHEFLYDRPIPHLRYFDWQAGARVDIDSGPTRMGRNRHTGAGSVLLQFRANAVCPRRRTRRGKNLRLVRLVPHSTPDIATSSRIEFLQSGRS